MGLGNVDNTSDANKPISTATQTALDAKAAAVHTHLLAAGATDVTSSASELNILDGATLSTTDLNYVDGVTSAIQTQLDAKIPLTQKGAANGVATLAADSKVPTSQLPALALTYVFVVASQAAQLALTAEEGDVAIRSDENKSYVHDGGTAGTMADWNELLTPTDSVLSVDGRTGAVTCLISTPRRGIITTRATTH